MINDQKMYNYLMREDWDTPFEIEGVVTEGIECRHCGEEIGGTKWRGDKELGVILCTPCYQRKHGAVQVKRGATLETEASGDEAEEREDIVENVPESREGTADSAAAPKKKSPSPPAHEGTANSGMALQTVPNTSPEFDSPAADEVLQSRQATEDVEATETRKSTTPDEREETIQSEAMPQTRRSISCERENPTPVAIMVIDD